MSLTDWKKLGGSLTANFAGGIEAFPVGSVLSPNPNSDGAITKPAATTSRQFGLPEHSEPSPVS